MCPDLLEAQAIPKQYSKDITSPISKTCKIWTLQVKFWDRTPDWACKIFESKLKILFEIGHNKSEFLS